jgi:hypothetical protein
MGCATPLRVNPVDHGGSATASAGGRSETAGAGIHDVHVSEGIERGAESDWRCASYGWPARQPATSVKPYYRVTGSVTTHHPARRTCVYCTAAREKNRGTNGQLSGYSVSQRACGRTPRLARDAAAAVRFAAFASSVRLRAEGAPQAGSRGSRTRGPAPESRHPTQGKTPSMRHFVAGFPCSCTGRASTKTRPSSS